MLSSEFRAQTETMLKDGLVAVVWSAYDHGDHIRGEVISTHKTNEAAQEKCKQSSFWQITYL